MAHYPLLVRSLSHGPKAGPVAEEIREVEEITI